MGVRRSLVGRLATTVAAVVAIGGGALGSSAGAALAQSASAAPRWQVFFTSARGPSVLTDVTAAGRSSAWAAGTNDAGLYLMHWNGKGWHQQTVPGSKNCIPYSVQATSGSSVWVMCDWAVNGPPTAFVLDDGTWRSVQLPDTATATAAGTADVWGYGAGGGSCTTGSSPVCTSQLWHWSAGTLTTFSLPGEVLSMTAAGGHAWVLSEHSMTSAGGTASGGLVTAYEASSGGLRKVAALGVRVGVFPQIAASPRGRIWVLDEGRGKHGRAAVYAWSERRWTRYLVPRSADFGSWGFTYDGSAGAWLGPYTHWTGKRWVITSPSGPTTKFELMFVAPVAGTSSAWAVGFNSARPGTRGYRGLIALLGRRP
jgi:hypothetical protein